MGIYNFLGQLAEVTDIQDNRNKEEVRNYLNTQKADSNLNDTVLTQKGSILKSSIQRISQKIIQMLKQNMERISLKIGTI